jgi:hypothetical protein
MSLLDQISAMFPGLPALINVPARIVGDLGSFVGVALIDYVEVMGREKLLPPRPYVGMQEMVQATAYEGFFQIARFEYLMGAGIEKGTVAKPAAV